MYRLKCDNIFWDDMRLCGATNLNSSYEKKRDFLLADLLMFDLFVCACVRACVRQIISPAFLTDNYSSQK